MSVNSYSMLQGLAQEAVHGLRSKRGTLADQVCLTYTEKSTEGDIPVYPSLHTLASIDTNTPLQNPLGVAPREEGYAMGSTSYKMARWDSVISTDKAILRDIEQFAQGANPLMDAIMAKVDLKIDRTLNTILVDTNVNASQGVGNGVWTLNNSTPSLDIQNAFNKTPGANICVIGLDVAQALGRHPEFKEKSSNYSGSGFSSFDTVKAVIGDITGIPAADVYIGESFFNSANKGQTLALTYGFSKTFWLGHKNGLLLVEQDYSGDLGDERPLNEGVVTVMEKHNMIEFGYGRVGQIKRAGDAHLGCVVTGVLT